MALFSSTIDSSVLIAANDIHISSVLVKLIEQVEVPSREPGVLHQIEVREGDMVSTGDLLAQIADSEAQLALDRARVEQHVARSQATNDVDIRYAQKSADVAQAELRRAADSGKKHPKSVSQSELDRLRLTWERTKLEVEQATHQFKITQLQQSIKENDVRAADEKISRHRVIAPIEGIVVEVNRHLGEWVEPGDRVFRILRVDQLRAEGFIDHDLVTHNMRGARVTLQLETPAHSIQRFPGKIVFVSPEVDPVDGKVRFWAEVENTDLQIRPGLRATMIIHISEIRSKENTTQPDTT